MEWLKKIGDWISNLFKGFTGGGGEGGGGGNILMALFQYFCPGLAGAVSTLTKPALASNQPPPTAPLTPQTATSNLPAAGALSAQQQIAANQQPPQNTNGGGAGVVPPQQPPNAPPKPS